MRKLEYVRGDLIFKMLNLDSYKNVVVEHWFMYINYFRHRCRFITIGTCRNHSFMATVRGELKNNPFPSALSQAEIGVGAIATLAWQCQIPPTCSRKREHGAPELRRDKALALCHKQKLGWVPLPRLRGNAKFRQHAHASVSMAPQNLDVTKH
jgi:hypothetical protein